MVEGLNITRNRPNPKEFHMKDVEESIVLADRIVPDRWTKALGWSVLAVLGFFAWTYFLERTACFDSAFFSWLMIDEEEPVSVLGRYGSWLAQLVPVVLIRSGVALDTVLRTYSLSFIAFHALIFLLLTTKWRDRRAAIALPIVLTAGFHYMFYYGISELYQGLSLTILLWAMIVRMLAGKGDRTYWKWCVGIALLNVAVSFFHQLLVLPLVFLLVYEGISTDAQRRRRLFFLGLVLIAWYVVRIKAFATSSYEAERMPTSEDLLNGLGRLRELNSTVYFLSVWTKFKAALLLIAMAGGLAVMQRAWLKLLWTMVFTAGFLVLILIVDRDNTSPIICENYYPVITLFWAVLFVTSLPERSGKAALIGPATLGLVCMLGLLQIHRAHYRFSEKVAYAERLTSFRAAHGSRKTIVQFSNYPWAYALGHWPLGMESALITAVDGPQNAATLFTSDDVALIDTASARKEQFLGPAWTPLWFGLQSLDARYFDLPMDTGYTRANTWVPDFNFDQLRLTGPRTPFRMFPDRFTVVPIVIHNPTALRMPSITADGAPFRFSYTLYRMDGTVYQESSELSSLETDIPAGATYYQGLVVERPVDPGRYVVKAHVLAGSVPAGASLSFEVVADRWPL